MTRTSIARVVRVGVAAAMIVIAGGRASTAQVITPKFKELTLDELGNLDTFKKLGDGTRRSRRSTSSATSRTSATRISRSCPPDDDQYEPDYKLPGTPELPALCKGSPKCDACFKQPYADLQNTRIRFERLRRLNKVTKDMLRDAISFGDAAASAAGGLAPLAWNSEKTKIRASEQTFNESYDLKYAELLATLQTNLFGIAACEEQIFGNESWFDRFGFMYQQFMAVAYRRPD
jgi:hypothetical protein